MRVIVFRNLFPIMLVCFLNVGSVFATFPESQAGAFSLTISPSTRVNGMGRAGVALTDEPSGYYNPAALAFTAREGNFITTNYVGKMDWLPTFVDGVTYSYNALSFGSEHRLSVVERGATSVPFSVSSAVGYYRTVLDTGKRMYTDSVERSVESAHNFVFSGSARFIAEVGAGATIKRIDMDYDDVMEMDAAFDLGVLAKLPLVDLAEYAIGSKLELYGLRPEISASAGASLKNLGGKIKWRDGYSDPLPRNFTHGYARIAGFTYHGPVTVNLVRYTDVRETYVPQIGGKSFAEVCNDKKRGWEVSFFDTYAIREGQFDDYDGEQHYEGRGETISSDGLFKVLAFYCPQTGVLSYIDYTLTHTSVNRTKFEYTKKSMYPMEHSQFTVLFRM